MQDTLACFKAYDVRGIVPDELNEELAYRIGRAYAAVISPRRVCVGRDVRPSGEGLVRALTEGLTDAGVDVVDIGLVGTEQVYFATFHYGLDGGIMVTASHNPPEYNGMKFVRQQARPISGDSGLREMEELTRRGAFPPSAAKGRRTEMDVMDDYVEHLLTYVDVARLKPFRIACNPGNGCAGPVLERLGARLPFELVMRYAEPDGSFPHGVPNPLLPENRAATAELVRESGADFGVAWDGDFDRCFLFDERGQFIEGYYIVGLLAQAVLRRFPGATILHDPRLVWNTVDIVESMGGRPVMYKTGHAFIKEKMREVDAAYGGEMSAHHYFRSFSYCDSGMIPWLLIAQLLSETDARLSTLVAERIEKFPVSGEINRRLADPDAALARLEARYGPGALKVDHVDGLSVEFDRWRFNVRKSNTEPLVRLNVETRGDRALLEEKTRELLAFLDEGTA
ncbi:MAG: phosphomannomutase CpsG [Limnochordales bacterium]|nr:phosphomannomutase CpsG [Limnochordales bacterium]